MRNPKALTAAMVLIVGLALTGCGSSSANNGSASDGPVVINITEKDGGITPDDGHVVKVQVGQEVRLNVSSDVDDEIHAHTEPEHEFEVTGGKDQTFTFTAETPGTSVIESHGLDITLVKLEIS